MTSLHDRINGALGVAGLPVQGVNVPQDHGHACIGGQGAADGSVGRAKDSCAVSGDSPDPFIGLGDLGLDAGGVQLGQIRMVIGMISQFAADFLHFTDGIRIRRNFLPQHKKGGVGIVFLQLGPEAPWSWGRARRQRSERWPACSDRSGFLFLRSVFRFRQKNSGSVPDKCRR